MSTNIKHTPGPWHSGAGNGVGCVFADEGRMRYENGTTLYPICSVIDMEGEQEANCDLIAAAPELLATLESLASSFETCLRSPPSTPQIWREVTEMNLKTTRAAIAKVTGEVEAS